MKDRRERTRYNKLTREDVEAIKLQLPHRSLAAISRDFGVSDTMVHYIKTGKQWS